MLTWGTPRGLSPRMQDIATLVSGLPQEGSAAADLDRAARLGSPAPTSGPTVTSGSIAGRLPLTPERFVNGVPLTPEPTADGVQPHPELPTPAPSQAPGLLAPGLAAGGAPKGLVGQPPSPEVLAQKDRDYRHNHRFFGRDGAWRNALGVLGDMLAVAGGGQAAFMPNLIRQRERKEELGDRQAQRESELNLAIRRMSQPQFANVENVGYVAVDPTTMTSRVVQPSRSDAQAYAEQLGLHPGDEGYNTAIADYALRGNGPTAFAQRGELQEDEQEAAAERLRLGIRSREGIAATRIAFERSDPRRVAPQPREPRAVTPSSVVGPLLARQARGERLTLSEQAVIDRYYAPRGRSHGRQNAGASTSQPAAAEGPATRRQVRNSAGQTITVEVRGGQWVDVATGRPAR